MHRKEPAIPTFSHHLYPRSGFVLLGETPEQELLLGLVGKFWTASGCIQRLNAAIFRNFATPGFAKAVWSFSLAAQPFEILLVAAQATLRDN
jgi:hypothetical protein